MVSKINRTWGYGLERRARLWADRFADGLDDLWQITKDGVKRAMRRRVKPRFWLFMIVATLLVFGASFAVMRIRYAQGEQRLARVQADQREMAIQVNLLNDRLTFAQTDEYIIRAARDELGMIMPGEVRYVNGAR